MQTTLTLALASTAALGFRHGLDYDHIAAISDITCLQPKAAKSVRLGVLYALGHAATIAVLGGTVILGRWAISGSIELLAGTGYRRNSHRPCGLRSFLCVPGVPRPCSAIAYCAFARGFGVAEVARRLFNAKRRPAAAFAVELQHLTNVETIQNPFRVRGLTFVNWKS